MAVAMKWIMLAVGKRASATGVSMVSFGAPLDVTAEVGPELLVVVVAVCVVEDSVRCAIDRADNSVVIDSLNTPPASLRTAALVPV